MSMESHKHKLRVTVTFSHGAAQSVDCDKMLRARPFVDIEMMEMFREQDKPKNPHSKWKPFYIVNMNNVASIYIHEHE